VLDRCLPAEQRNVFYGGLRLFCCRRAGVCCLTADRRIRVAGLRCDRPIEGAKMNLASATKACGRQGSDVRHSGTLNASERLDKGALDNGSRAMRIGRWQRPSERPARNAPRFASARLAVVPCLLAAALSVAVCCSGAVAAEPGPKGQSVNVVFLLADDLRFNTLGFMGDRIVQTPHLDRLASRGIVFRNAFVTTSICASSRASIFAGQWMLRHGIEDFQTAFTPEAWRQTYPAVFREAGYRTGFIGKYGVGSPTAIAAQSEAFDYWRGLPGQAGRFFIDPNDPTRTHRTAQFGNEALEFIRAEDSGRPFCLSVSFNAPHARDREPREFEPDPRDEPLYAGARIPLPPTATEAAFERLPEFVKKSEGRRRWTWRFDEPEKAQRILRDYYRLISGIDREVGRIVSALEERGLADCTVIVFSSDNGFALGDRGLADKWFMWEEDIRVPLLIYDPRLPADRKGTRIDQIALNVDLAPTMLDLAGLPVPKAMQGRSLVPLLRGETPADWRVDFFYEHRSVPKIIPPCEGVRGERWKYIRWIGSEPLVEELYDLRTDPLEEHNLAGDAAFADQLAKLRSRWAELREELRSRPEEK